MAAVTERRRYALKLNDLAEIQIGYQHRDSARPVSAVTTGTHRFIQIKDLDLEGRFKSEVLDRGGIVPYIWLSGLFGVTPSSDARRYQVDQGDVLFLSRGQRSIAVAIPDPLQETIAAYYFYILRPDRSRILPEYLAWFINQPSAQVYLETNRMGSHIKMVPKPALEQLEIALPSIATQGSIVQLEKLRQAEEHAMVRLIKARKKLIDGLALEAAVNGGTHSQEKL
ncbi:MAG: restriction endonuclease subunit S [Elusimicrobiota bacterium]